MDYPKGTVQLTRGDHNKNPLWYYMQLLSFLIFLNYQLIQNAYTGFVEYRTYCVNHRQILLMALGLHLPKDENCVFKIVLSL